MDATVQDTTGWDTATRDAVVAADASGDLLAACRLAQRVVLAASGAGDVRGQAEALLLLARVARHRRDAASLRRARDAAAIVVQLCGTPLLAADAALRSWAELELAACLVASGRVEEGWVAAAPHRSVVSARLSGWAWTTMGQARLAQGRTREAVALLSNALAEFEREASSRRVYTARVWLARALTEAGDLEHGAALLDADRAYWCGAGVRRLQIEHHLALAENLRHRGRVAEARTVLDEVAALLADCTGLESTEVRLLQQQAACDLDWQQGRRARRRLQAAETLRAGLAADAEAPRASAVPPPAPTRALGVGGVGARGQLHHDLGEAAHALGDALVSEGWDPVAGVEPGGSASGAASGDGGPESLAAEVSGLVAWVSRHGAPDAGAIERLVLALEELAAVPGAERLEATLLVRAGKRLRCLNEPRLLDAERLLRRALVRLARLPGLGLWEARARVGLALTLKDAGRFEEALPHALRGVEALDAERFAMRSREVRVNWTGRQAKAFDCAIELAHRCGREDIAADLVVFTRAAGVVTGSVGRLVPVPRLRYLDGALSSLGSGEPTRFA